MLIFTAIWSLFLLLIGLTVTGVFPSYAGSFYWFTLSFLFHTATCFFLSVKCQIRPNADLRKKITWSIRLLPLSWFFAMVQWPGGDDGPGLAWMLFVGGASVLSLIGSPLGQLLNKPLIRQQ